MCWRCDEPQEPLHDRHYWSAWETLHQNHVRDWQTERMDQYFGQFGMKRVDMSKVKLAPASEIVVQPMMPPMPFVPAAKFDFSDVVDLDNWHVVAYRNDQMLKLIKSDRYQQVIAGREDGAN